MNKKETTINAIYLLILLVILTTVLTSCEDANYQPTDIDCLDSYGTIIEANTDLYNPFNHEWCYTYKSELLVATRCDTVSLTKIHVIEDVDYVHSMDVITYSVGDLIEVIRY